MCDGRSGERRGTVRLSRLDTRLEDVLDAVPNPVSVWDTELRNVYANRAAYARWFGRTPEELRGMHSRDLLGPELYARNRRHQLRCLAGEPQVFERDIPGPDGEVRRAQIEYHPYRQHGEVVGLITVITDVSERVSAERAAAVSSAQVAALTERRRIQDRAHEVGLQALFAAQLKLDRLRATTDGDPDVREAVEAALAAVGEAIGDLRAATSATDADRAPSAR